MLLHNVLLCHVHRQVRPLRISNVFVVNEMQCQTLQLKSSKKRDVKSQNFKMKSRN